MLKDFWVRINKFITIFVVQQIRLLILKFNIKHIFGPENIEYHEDELIVLCLVRNGQLWMKSFVEHYFSLGAKHIVFLDNGSDDDTILAAQAYENVTIFQTNLPFKHYKLVMRQYLIKRYGKQRWSLYVDIDEFFDYPYSDVLPLQSLLNYLNQKSYTAVVTHMLDMFSSEPLSNQNNSPDMSLDSYKYYDISDITKTDYFYKKNVPNKEIKIYFGGIRRTLFGADSDKLGVMLTKHPLIFLDQKIYPMYLGEHGVRNARIADFTCVLFHYKLVSNFYDRTVQAVEEESYYQNSAEYKRYLAVLGKNPSLEIRRETSQKINSVNDLIKNQFLIVSQDYLNWVKNKTSKR